MKKLAILALLLVASVAQAQKISADPTASTLVGSEYLAGVQSGANVKVLPSQIQTLTLTTPTTTGKLTTAASTTGGAGLRLPHGAAPTSPTDGDVWTTSAGGFYARINGTTVGPFGAGGGSGTVTSLSASGGVQTTTGSAITTTGTLQGAHAINAQTGTTYAILAVDRGAHVTFSNSASIAVSIAAAGGTGFENGYFSYLENIGVGAVTLTPTTSTINGATTLVLTSGMTSIIFSDGSNYRAFVFDRSGVTVNAQTGTSYTYLSGDRAKLVTHSNASAIAGALPQATGAFGSGWTMFVQNRGVGTLTITPTTSTIDGTTTLALTTGQGALVVSDGTNYFTMRGVGGAGGGGSLTNWTEAVNSSTPNATIPVASFTTSNAATNVDAAFVPKGTGSILASVPDNTSTGGNKRGTQAVDLQLNRSANTDVASGAQSFVAGFQSRALGSASVAIGNTAHADGAASVAIGGVTNNVTAANGAAIGGSNLTVSAQYGAALGGQSNTVSSNGGVALGGQANTVNGLDSVAIGNNAGSLTLPYAFTQGAIGFGRTNDAQTIRAILQAVTTDATPTVVTAGGGTVGTTTILTLPQASFSGSIRGRITAYQHANGGGVSFDIKALVFRGANGPGSGNFNVVASSVTLVGSTTSATAWTVTLTADTTNQGLLITVTGETGKTIHWLAVVEEDLVS